MKRNVKQISRRRYRLVESKSSSEANSDGDCPTAPENELLNRTVLEIQRRNMHLNRENSDSDSSQAEPSWRVPKQQYGHPLSGFKLNLRRWASTDDEEQLAKTVQISQMTLVVDSPQLDFCDCLNLFAILDRFNRLDDQLSRKRLVSEAVWGGLLRADRLTRIREVVSKSGRFELKDWVDALLSGLASAWEFLDTVSELVPELAGLAHKAQLAELTEYVVQNAEPYLVSDSLIDESDFRLQQNLHLLNELSKETMLKRKPVDRRPARAGTKEEDPEDLFQLPELNEVESEGVWNPPNSFRDFDDQLQPEEFQAWHELYLSPVLAKGAYQSLEHYLDVHYRLLRAEFVWSIKREIRAYKLGKKLGANRQKRPQSAVFRDVRVIKFVVTASFSGLCLRVPCEKPSAPGVPRLAMQPGSMVLLSRTGFETSALGVVRNRSGGATSTGVEPTEHLDVVVELTDAAQTVTDNFLEMRDSRFEMLHSRSLFDNYHFTLRALKTLRTLPLESVIVQCDNWTNKMPEYARKYKEEINWEIRRKDGLDASQRRALESTFQESVLAIHGPPGTGKTFLGLEIVQVVVHLKRTLDVLQSPVLVLFSSDQALDRFLEHVLQFTNRVGRLGGVPRRAHLSNYSLGALSRKNIGARSSLFRQLETRQSRLIKEANQLIGDFIEMTSCGLLSPKYLVLGESQAFKQKLVGKFDVEFEKFVKKIPENTRTEYGEFFRVATAKIEHPWFWFWLRLIDFDLLWRRFQQRQKSPFKLIRAEESRPPDSDAETASESPPEFEQPTPQIESKTQTIQGVLRMAPLSHFGGSGFASIRAQVKHLQAKFSLGTRWVQELAEAEASFKKTGHSDFPAKKRWIIHQSLLRRSLQRLPTLIEETRQKVSETSSHLQILREQEMVSLLSRLDVLAVTATAASKHKATVARLESKVVLVCQAGQLLEAQVASWMGRRTEHLVLIADHQRLRASVSSCRLAKKYNLEVSLFERLIRNDFPNRLLRHQRRMHPDISCLVEVAHPCLANSPLVHDLEGVRGVPMNAFILSHSQHGQSDADTKTNVLEAEMAVAFAEYLLKQGHQAHQITVLSPYIGQVMLLRQLVSQNESVRGVAASAVDNFQGEENDVIILSLVRSPEFPRTGFVHYSNRVRSALSRARRGLFIFGNPRVLRGSTESPASAHEPKMAIGKTGNENTTEAAEQHALWKRILDKLEAKGGVLRELELKCATHAQSVKIRKPRDFLKTPNGGCTQLCGTSLSCGHVCSQMCHPVPAPKQDNDGHDEHLCLKPCIRPKACGHECPYKCFECRDNPMPCLHPVEIKYPCGHLNQLECHIFENNKGLCMEACSKKLECGHVCLKKCHEDCSSLSLKMIGTGYLQGCQEPVDKQLPCGHMKELGCGQDVGAFVEYTGFICREQCGDPLPGCNHPCQRKCHQCEGEIFHADCVKECEHLLTCGHLCTDTCSGRDEQCQPCGKDCEAMCSHSKCPKVCGEVCVPCTEPCDSRCAHSACSKMCYQPCDRAPCQEPCDRDLECGHKCIGLCGETCPQICRVCDEGHEVFEVHFGKENEPQSRFVLLPDCGHVIEVQALERFLYVNSEQSRRIELPKCPKCGTPIRHCPRYRGLLRQFHRSLDKIKRRSKQILEEAKRSHVDPQSDRSIRESAEELCEREITRIRNKIIRKRLQVIGHQLRDNLARLERPVILAPAHISTVASTVKIWLGLLSIIKANQSHIELKHFEALETLLTQIVKPVLGVYMLKRLASVADCFELYFSIQAALRERQKNRHILHGSSCSQSESAAFRLEVASRSMLEKGFIISDELSQVCEQHLQTIQSTPNIKADFPKYVVERTGPKRGSWYECAKGHVYVDGHCDSGGSECPECEREFERKRNWLVREYRQTRIRFRINQPALHAIATEKLPKEESETSFDSEELD